MCGKHVRFVDLLVSSPPLCYDAFLILIFFMMDTTLERHDGADWGAWGHIIPTKGRRPKVHPFSCISFLVRAYAPYVS